MKLGYWIELAKAKFSEQGYIQVMPIGKYEHPVYGEIDFNQERIQAYYNNFKAGVRGIELDIDYDHKAHNGKAAGWIKDLLVQPDGLWALVDWTEPAASAIKAGEYRYFSPEFDDEWVDAQGNKHKDVLFGGALTNRPYLKDLMPVNLSELTTPREEAKLDPKELRKKLGLSETATDEEVTKKLDELQAPPALDVREKLGLPKDATDEQVEEKLASLVTPPKKEDPDPDPELKALAEKSPAVKKLMETVQKQTADIVALQSATKLAEVSQKVKQLTSPSEGKKFTVPLAAEDKLQAILLQVNDKVSEDLITMLSEVLDTGLVELGETEISINPASQSGDVSKKFHELITKKITDAGGPEKLAYADAVSEVAREHKELFEAYRKAAYLTE